MADEFDGQDVPVHCVLAHKNLSDIQKMITETNAEVKNLSAQLISANGYIPRIHERLSIVELSAERAHSRLDVQRHDIDTGRDHQNSLAVKVGGLVAVLSGLVYFLIGKVM
jgi:hypothetical protein